MCMSESGLKGKLVQINSDYELGVIQLSPGLNQDVSKPLSEIKPILHRLSDITDDDARIVYIIYFGKTRAEDWTGDTGSAYFRPKEVAPTINHALRIFSGDDYSSDAIKVMPKLFKYLLSKGYWLFGDEAFDQGLIIDSKTLK